MILAAACSDSTGPDSGSMTLSITSGPATVRQGDVVTYAARTTGGNGTPAAGPVQWNLAPASAGLITPGGRFVGYEPGPARVIASAGALADTVEIVIQPRGLVPGNFTVVGHGAVDERFTSDLWLVGTTAYTGTWGQRLTSAGAANGDRLYAWDISDPAAPVRTDSVLVNASVVNDIKVREDGTLAVLTHESAPDGLNGITILDTSSPLHPSVITRFTDEMTAGVHNVWVDGSVVYAVVDGSAPDRGLRVVDVSSPSSPGILARFFGGTGTGFGEFLHDVYVRDGLAFLSHWNVGLVILDVGGGTAGGSPANPVEVGRIRTQGDQTHNAWYWPAMGYVFVGEEDFTTPGIMHVVDAGDPGNPVEVATFRVPGQTPHNFWLDEERAILYLAWYGNGLRALDVSGQLLGQLERQGREIASIMYNGPGGCVDPTGSMTCTWAPQLHDGLVWVSDMNSGLWALRPGF